jgi:16S rRNA (adenine1518-N6/adenine1519-N6)-dimethyltransferase
MTDPASPSNANALLRAQGLRPRKRWGQNFLCDRNMLDRIVRAAALEPGDKTLEIGAGLGALTRPLADHSVSVTSVEIDRLLQPILQETLAGKQNVHLVFEDFLKLDLASLLDDAFGDRPGVVVANIPYYITTPILERLIEYKRRIKRVVLLVQWEFAQRLAALPATEDYGSMSVFAQYHTRVELVGKVPRQVFLPPPEVSTALVTLTPVTPGSITVRDEALFFRIVRASFGQRRKTIANALSSKETSFDREAVDQILATAHIDPGRRGETLSLEEFAQVADAAAALAEAS